MTDCADLIDDLHAQARDHVNLAAVAAATPMAEMHIDLALFSEAQARVAGGTCVD